MKRGFLKRYGFLLFMLLGIGAGCVAGAAFPVVKDGAGAVIRPGATVLEPLGTVCSVAADTMLLVLSGEVNEFYATEWEIWFTPEAGGEPRCLGKQEFLLMGGDAWW